ncbi:MAG: glycosyl transferase family 28 [Actinomycetota bacterium]|nr:glycosyl transferase family 28 [Actinomycetota bacterium]
MSVDTEDPIRVLLYSHDSQGLGHIRRNLALAHALAQQLPQQTGRPVTGLLLTGVGHAASAELPDGFDVVVLPGVCKGQSGYRPRHVQMPMAELIDVRGQMLGAVIGGFRPDLVIIDRHAHGVDGELQAALARLRRDQPRASVVLGLREVLDSPAVAIEEWARLGDPQVLRDTFDEIWVYGDPEVHDPRASGEVPLALRDLVRFTGYLAAGRRATPSAEPDVAPYLLTMVGGGSDGQALCRIAVRAPVPAGYRHLIVTGPQMPQAERRQIERSAGPRTQVVDAVPDGLTTIRGASAVIAMAGYNTTCEIMSTDTPALLVPRETPRMEQRIRAEGLSRIGAVEVCRQPDLTAERLGRWMADAVGRQAPRRGIDLRGLSAVVRRAARLVQGAPQRVVSGVAG